MKISDLKNFTITADSDMAFMKEASGLLAQPKLKIHQDGVELPLFVKAHLRMEHVGATDRAFHGNKVKAASRNAIAGRSPCTAGEDSMPFYDIRLLGPEGGEDKPLINIEDVSATILNNQRIKEYKVQYRLNIHGKEITELDMQGVDAWKLTAFDKHGENKAGSIDPESTWIFMLINAILYFIPDGWVKMLPIELTDIVGINYLMTYEGKELGQLKSDRSITEKSCEITIHEGLSEREHELAVSMAMLMSYYIARNFYSIDHAMCQDTFD